MFDAPSTPQLLLQLSRMEGTRTGGLGWDRGAKTRQGKVTVSKPGASGGAGDSEGKEGGVLLSPSC